jgi:hypothetical protein
MHRAPRLALVIALVPLALAACAKPESIECPTAQLPANGVLADTSADIKAYGEMFAEGYQGNVIPEAIRSIRAKYPGASDSEVRNFLIAAYCPIARGTAVGKEAQQAALGQFEAALGANLAP